MGLSSFIAKTMLFAKTIALHVKDLRETKVPYIGANKMIDINTQSLKIATDGNTDSYFKSLKFGLQNGDPTSLAIAVETNTPITGGYNDPPYVFDASGEIASGGNVTFNSPAEGPLSFRHKNNYFNEMNYFNGRFSIGVPYYFRNTTHTLYVNGSTNINGQIDTSTDGNSSQWNQAYFIAINLQEQELFKRLETANLEFMQYSHLHLNDNFQLTNFGDESKLQTIEGTNYQMREPYLYMKGKELPGTLSKLMDQGYEIKLQVGRFLPKRNRRARSDINNPIDTIGINKQKAKYRYRREVTTPERSNFSCVDFIEITREMLEFSLSKNSQYLRLDEFNLASFFNIILDYDASNSIILINPSIKGVRSRSMQIRLCFRFILTKSDSPTLKTRTLGYLSGRINRNNQTTHRQRIYYNNNYLAGYGAIGGYHFQEIK